MLEWPPTQCGDGRRAGKYDRGSAMNEDTIKGQWKQLSGKMKEKWGKLTDDEFDQMAGNRDQLVGKIQERYGMTKDEAERQVNDWETRM
jgi:uncharacterized protein YjbJ (UPF0337 family)